MPLDSLQSILLAGLGQSGHTVKVMGQDVQRILE